MNYSNMFGSNFPNEVISVGTKKDIDNSAKILITQYYSYINAGDIIGANTLYQMNKDVLEPYIINSAYFNKLEEEIYNAGLMALSGQNIIISDTEPALQETNSHWLKEW